MQPTRRKPPTQPTQPMQPSVQLMQPTQPSRRMQLMQPTQTGDYFPHFARRLTSPPPLESSRGSKKETAD
eukprot:7134668-Karenia_brevis.AAC.1